MSNIIIAVVVSLLLGGVVNLLANWLPQFSRTYQERLEEGEDDGEESAPAAAESPSPAIDESAENAQERSPLFRYIAVELVLALAAVYLVGREGLTPMFAVLLGYLAIFILIAVIDIEHLLVPDIVIVPAFVLALLELTFNDRLSFQRALMGYAVGQLIILGLYLLARVYLWVVNTARSKPVSAIPFGFGDVTLVTFCGLVVGFPHIIYLLFLMIIFGGALAVLVILGRSLIFRKYQAHTAMPYAPAILLAAAVVLLWPERVLALLTGS